MLLWATPNSPAAAAPKASLFTAPYVAEVLRHLYRWHLDETAMAGLLATPSLAAWSRPLELPRDEGDQSRFGELVFPQLRFRVLLKQADYLVPETGLRMTNADYRIVSVDPYEALPAPYEYYTQMTLDRTETQAELARTRGRFAYPDEALLQRLRVALRDQIAWESVPAGAQTVYVGPLSPVANELWVYWENGARIVRFSADADLATPAFWAHSAVSVDVYDLREDVVVSLSEVAGSNAYVTRDWAARVVFNCVVHGRRLLITPVEDLQAPMQAAPAPLGSAQTTRIGQDDAPSGRQPGQK